MNRKVYTGWNLVAGDTISETTKEGVTYVYKIVGSTSRTVTLQDEKGRKSEHDHATVYNWVHVMSKERDWYYYPPTVFDEGLFEL